MSKWLLFSVCLGALPIGGFMVVRVMNGQEVWSAALDHGQLFIAAVGISGASIGRLATHDVKEWAQILIAIGVLQVALGAYLYGSLVYGSLAQTPTASPTGVVVVSVIWWLISLFLGAWAVALNRE